HGACTWWLVALGALAAGAAAAAEAAALRRVVAPGPGRPRRFYLMALLVAASPLPFTIARAACFKYRPRPWAFGLAGALGGAPRCAAPCVLGGGSAPRGGVRRPATIGAVGVALAGLLWQAGARRWVRARSSGRAARWARESSRAAACCAARRR